MSVGLPITLVCGFPRSGSSLTMQMLAAGGMPMTGIWPDFEDDRASPSLASRNNAAWLLGCTGKAVKLLDPHRFTLPPAPGGWCVIWCTRNPREQARSQAKFLRLMAGIQTTRNDVRMIERSYPADEARAYQVLTAAGSSRPLRLRFEETLRAPRQAAQALAEHCSHIPLDVKAMADAVMPRNSRCAPALDMEMMLLDDRERWRKS